MRRGGGSSKPSSAKQIRKHKSNTKEGASVASSRKGVLLESVEKSPIASAFVYQASTTKPVRRKQATSSRAIMFSSVFSRSTSYDRLDGGRGSSRQIGAKFGWKKFAIGAAVLIGFVWVLGPRESRRSVWLGGTGAGNGSSISPGYGGMDEDLNISPPTSIKHDPKPSLPLSSPDSGAIVHPSSPATDPDMLKTTHCTSAYKAGVPIVQYALMIDAGSTGSRIHIYKFNNCGPSPSYEYEAFKQRQPGLSSYGGDPSRAAQSLDELLDEAVRVVPESLWKCTPVAVKATAGLRMLGSVESSEILEAVRQRLREKYEFNLESDDDVVIMDGKDEGLYAWITVNYLLKTIRGDRPSSTTPYAVLDLGGASTQIVFEPEFDEARPDSTLKDGEHKYELKFGGETRVLYQHSYLGYGLKEARGSVHRLVEFLAPASDIERGIIANPCLARGTMKDVTFEDTRSKTNTTVTMHGADVGGIEACNRIVQLVMAKDAICEVKPCSFSGVYQPSLLETFPHGKVLLLSYFYDRIRPLLTKEEAAEPVKISSIASLAEDVCLGKDAWTKRWGHDADAMKELEGRPEHCLDLTFMHSLLRLGYEFTGEREVNIGKQIEGTELGWCLGATIAMVGAEIKCRV